MPTSPEVRQGTGFIGFAEIDGELETEKGGNTDGYVTYLWGANGIDNFWFNME